MFHKDLKADCQLYRMENERDLDAFEINSLISAVLYEHRFGPLFVSPITVGFDNTGKPICGGFDSIGAPAISDWIADGTGAHFLMGPAE